MLLSAKDGPLGIQLARSARPDVILMDINLPGMSGIKAMQILRADPATAHIPVVALSANAIPRDIERGLQAGFFRSLTKPIKYEFCKRRLALALRKERRELLTPHNCAKDRALLPANGQDGATEDTANCAFAQPSSRYDELPRETGNHAFSAR